ncbi:MAG: class I SAM-dependent methyltransferase [Endomicrobiales bacterium]|nr:class I SAM-dependent methyltransferase [Endomicrobiales bacterium]
MRPKIAALVEYFYEPKNLIIGLFFRIIPYGRRLMYHIPMALSRHLFRYKPYMSPRLVEYPFVFMNLKLDKGNILDAGCCWNPVGLQLASLGFRVWGVDFNKYELTHPNFTFVQSDICHMDFEDNFFDRVINISVIEHVGLGFYGDPKDSADYQAMIEFRRVLKPGGKLLLTTHYGKKFENQSYRVYDSESLNFILKGFRLEKIEYFRKANNNWYPCTKDEADMVGLDERNRPNGLVMVVAVKE